MEAVFVFISLFLVIFGISYLYLSTRNKERLALIEKGADASIFMKGNQRTAPIWKVLILNIALLLMGIGAGAFIALLINTYTSIRDHAVEVSTIFFMAGVGLFTGFHMTKNLDKD